MEVAPFQTIWEAMDTRIIEITTIFRRGHSPSRHTDSTAGSPAIPTSPIPKRRMSTESLRDKIAIVTGASSGSVRQRHSPSQKREPVSLAARRESSLRELADDIERMGRKAIVLPTDVTQRGQVESMTQAVLSQWGRVDILISNAGIYSGTDRGSGSF